MDRAALYVQESLRQVGIRMEIQPVDLRVVRQRMESGRFQAIFTRQNVGDAYHRLRLFGEGSWLEVRNSEAAQLLESIAMTIDPEARDSIYRQLWPYFREELPVTFLYPLVVTTVADRRVKGLVSPFRADPVMHAEELWLNDSE